jgi:hypothetical protein
MGNLIEFSSQLRVHIILANLRSEIEQVTKSVQQLFDSKILKGFLHKGLFQLCEFPVGTKWQLLYRASQHGFKAQKFHAKCDNHANTLVVVKSATSDFIFGGYTEQFWNPYSRGGFRTDKNAFLFSLTNKDNFPCKMRVKNPEEAIYCYASYGPAFGFNSCDLYISNMSNSNSISNSVDLGRTYEPPGSSYTPGSNEAKCFLAGSEWFQVSEIEVFQRK